MTPHPIPSQPPPSRRPQSRRRKLLAVTTLGLAGFVAGLLCGCSGLAPSSVSAANGSKANTYTSVAGNWQITTGSASDLVLAGSLAVSGSSVSGVLHPLAGACLGPAAASASFPVSGSISTSGLMSLISNNFPGGQITVEGVLTADQHALITPAIAISGGQCATPAAPAIAARDGGGATAQQFQPVNGVYTGTLISSSGTSLAVTAHLSQPTTPDSSGVYHLSGMASFDDTACIQAPVLTYSTVTGATLTTTYTDPTTGNTVTGTGTLSADAGTLTIAHWTLSGSCGTDSGSGLLTRSGPA